MSIKYFLHHKYTREILWSGFVINGNWRNMYVMESEAIATEDTLRLNTGILNEEGRFSELVKVVI